MSFSCHHLINILRQNYQINHPKHRMANHWLKYCLPPLWPPLIFTSLQSVSQTVSQSVSQSGATQARHSTVVEDGLRTPAPFDSFNFYVPYDSNYDGKVTLVTELNDMMLLVDRPRLYSCTSDTRQEPAEQSHGDEYPHSQTTGENTEATSALVGYCLLRPLVSKAATQFLHVCLQSYAEVYLSTAVVTSAARWRTCPIYFSFLCMMVAISQLLTSQFP